MRVTLIVVTGPIGLDYMTYETKTSLGGVMGPAWITPYGSPMNLTTTGEKIVWLLETMATMTLTGRSGMTTAAKTGNPTSAANLQPLNERKVVIMPLIWTKKIIISSF